MANNDYYRDFSKTSRSLLLILALLFLAYEMMLQVMPSVITHELMQDLSFNETDIGIISGVYFITYVVMQIPAGIMFDLFSTRRVMMFACILCIAGTVLFSYATHYSVFLLARLLLGAGSAFAFTGVLIVCARLFPVKLFTFFSGIAQLTACIGAFGGQYLISVLSDKVMHWRTLTEYFTVACALLLIGYYFSKPLKAKHQHDDIGLKLIMTKMRAVMKSPQNWYCAWYAFALWAPMGAFSSLWGVPFLENKYGISTKDASLIIMYSWIGLGIGAPLISYYTQSIKDKRYLLGSFACIALVCLGFIILKQFDAVQPLNIFLLVLGVACVGQVLTFEYVKHNNPETHVGTALSFNNSFMVFSSLIMQPLIGFMITGSKDSISNLVLQYEFGLKSLLVLLIGGIALGGFMIKKNTQAPLSNIDDA